MMDLHRLGPHVCRLMEEPGAKSSLLGRAGRVDHWSSGRNTGVRCGERVAAPTPDPVLTSTKKIS